MALTKPIVGTIRAFDATIDKVIEFTVQSGQQVIGNTIIIKNQETGEEVYNNYLQTFQYSHLIPANTLINGDNYQVTIQTSGINEGVSPISNPVQFKCLTTPQINISNIPSSGIVQSSNYNFTGNYYQEQGELLQSFEFNLYNNNNILLSTSGVKYSTDIQYTFSGLEDNSSYYIELIINTVNGMVVSTERILFNVDYIEPSFFTVNQLENLCDTGQIQISSNIIVIIGESFPIPPKYINNKEVDLKEKNSYVSFNDGFSINDNFTLKLIGRDFISNSEIIRLTGENKNIVLRWVIDNYTFDSEVGFVELYVYNLDTSSFKYYIKSNYIGIPNETENIFIWLQNVDNLFDLQIENLGVEI